MRAHNRFLATEKKNIFKKMNGTKDDCVKQTKPQSKTSYQET